MSPDQFQTRRLVLAHLGASPRHVHQLLRFVSRFQPVPELSIALRELERDGLIVRTDADVLALTDAGRVAFSQL